MKALFALRILRLAAAALLTAAFVSGCQTPDARIRTMHSPPEGETIHVPPGGAWTYLITVPNSGKITIDIAAVYKVRLLAGSTIQPKDEKEHTVSTTGKYRVEAGTKITLVASCEIDLPTGSTIHVPPGGDASKEGPAVERLGRSGHHQRPHPGRTMAPPPAAITHPGG